MPTVVTMPTGEHKSGAYVRARAKLKAMHLQPCVLCSEWIDYTLDHPHPMSFAAEHVVPVRDGGDHRTLAPSHLRCQNVQGGQVRAGIEVASSWTSGVW
jgi:hypothetical protein